VPTNGPYGGVKRCLTVSGTNLFANTFGGIYLSTNNGTNWVSVNTNLIDTTGFSFVCSLAVSDTNLFAGTEDGVVLMRPLSEMITGVKDQQYNLPKSYSLQQNYPNPFNPTTTINYSILKAGSVTIKVYDVLGCEVTTLVNENKPVGNYSVKFDASKLSSGIYIYTIRANDFVQSKKMNLVK